MRWAILGTAEQRKSLVLAPATCPEIEPYWVPLTEWASLVARPDCEAVLVDLGGEELLREDLLKKLAGAGIPLMVTHPAADVLTAYELEVIRRERGSPLLPFAPGWLHPAWDRLAGLTANEPSQLPAAEMVSISRVVFDHRRESVLVQVSQDIHIIRRLLGTVTSINAAGSLREDGSWSSLTVQFTGGHRCSAIWSLALPASSHETIVSVAGPAISATLRISGSGEHETWELQNPDGTREVIPYAGDAAGLLQQLRVALRGGEPVPNWSDACLDLEIADAVAKSLRKKRTIDLDTSEQSEEKTFKSFMSAAGCLMLVAILVVIFILAIWDGIRGPFRTPPEAGMSGVAGPGSGSPAGTPWPFWIRLWPVYPVLAFLLLQLLLILTRTPRSSTDRGQGLS